MKLELRLALRLEPELELRLEPELALRLEPERLGLRIRCDCCEWPIVCRDLNVRGLVRFRG